MALLLVAFLGRWVTVASNQILQGAPWWVQVVLGVVGLLAIAWAVATSREPARQLRTVRGFLGAPPGMPDRLVERPDLSKAAVAALRAGRGPVALTGMGGAGKSTLAAGACGDRRVRRRFRDGVTWLEADPGQDPVTLLGDLARRLGLPESESGFTTVAQGRDKIAAVLRGKADAGRLTGHHGPVDAVAVTADGTRAVSGGRDDRTVRVWDLVRCGRNTAETGHATPNKSLTRADAAGCQRLRPMAACCHQWDASN